jgi:hypothetical protein
MEVPGDSASQPPAEQPQFPWRAAIFAAIAIGLIVAAIVLYNTGRQIVGLAALGLGFAVPMAWGLIAAREATDADSAVRRFIPRIMIYLVAGTGFLGIFWWNVDRRVSLMEAGFGAFYVVAGLAAMRMFDAKRPSLRLRAVTGRKTVNIRRSGTKRDMRGRPPPRK